MLTVSMCRSYSNSWIGLYKYSESSVDPSPSAQYWLDGSTSSFRRWRGNNPDSSTTYCFRIARTSGTFNDGPCNREYVFVCKKNGGKCVSCRLFDLHMLILPIALAGKMRQSVVSARSSVLNQYRADAYDSRLDSEYLYRPHKLPGQLLHIYTINYSIYKYSATVLQSVVSVHPFVFTLAFKPTDLWPDFFACAWVVIIPVQGLKVIILGPRPYL